MNWRIAVPVVVLVGVIGYLIYGVVSKPAYEQEQLLPVTLKRFTETLLKKRNAQKLAKYCSPSAVNQCDMLLVEIRKRESSQANFRFADFSVGADASIPGKTDVSINLKDARMNTFLVVDCKVAQLPDHSYQITAVSWRPPIQP